MVGISSGKGVSPSRYCITWCILGLASLNGLYGNPVCGNSSGAPVDSLCQPRARVHLQWRHGDAPGARVHRFAPGRRLQRPAQAQQQPQIGTSGSSTSCTKVSKVRVLPSPSELRSISRGGLCSANQMGMNDVSNLVMCVQAGTHGWPTPLVVNLPRHFTSSSPWPGSQAQVPSIDVRDTT